MQLLSKFDKEIRFLLCVVGIFCKYAWVVPLKDKKRLAIVNAFQKILDNWVELYPKSRKAKSKGLKPSKIWVDKGREFYNNLFKIWLKDNDIEMYPINNERKSAVAEGFITILKNKIYENMTSISKNVYIDRLDDIVNEYNM